jgi:hypothetical protein
MGFATTVLSDAQPLHFAGKCFDWMQLQPNEHESERLFIATDEERLRTVLAERIAEYATRASLLAGRPEDFIPLLHVWHAAQGGTPVQAHVGAELVRGPEIATMLIIPFANVDRTGITREKATTLLKGSPNQSNLSQRFGRWGYWTQNGGITSRHSRKCSPRSSLLTSKPHQQRINGSLQLRRSHFSVNVTAPLGLSLVGDSWKMPAAKCRASNLTTCTRQAFRNRSPSHSSKTHYHRKCVKRMPPLFFASSAPFASQ